MLMKQAKPKSKILPMPKRGNGNGGVAATS
jgi:hypothetical protein